MTHWTFESLAAADRGTLEEVLLTSRTPDPALLRGWAYDGYNHDRLGQLAGAKFRKVFLTGEDAEYGLNQVVARDSRGYRGEWRVKQKDGRPMEHAYFRIVPASSIECPGPYAHLLGFDYNVDRNPRWNVLMCAIRDFVGLPNGADHGLLLGKAYPHLPSGRQLFASYFILGRRGER